MIDATFIRPNNTTPYTAGDIIANDTVAASVVPMPFTATPVSGGAGMVRRARMRKSQLTTALGQFRLHLYGTDPSAASGIVNGDNGVWSTKHADYLGSIDFDFTAATTRTFTDAVHAIGVPAVGSEISFAPAAGQIVYGLLEARAAYVPAANESFTCILEVV